jgi:hypothetical protein
VYDIGNDIKELNIDTLVFPCVLKTNHWSGDVRIIKNKYELLTNNIINHFKSKLSNIYNKNIERHYSYIIPKIIAEEYLGEIPIEYKFECIWGQPVTILAVNIPSEKRYYYTTCWDRLAIYKQTDKFEEGDM